MWPLNESSFDMMVPLNTTENGYFRFSPDLRINRENFKKPIWFGLHIWSEMILNVVQIYGTRTNQKPAHIKQAANQVTYMAGDEYVRIKLLCQGCAVAANELGPNKKGKKLAFEVE